MNGSVYYLWLQLSRGVTRWHAQYYFCQLSKFVQLQIVNGAAAQLASGRQATVAGCVIDRAVSSKGVFRYSSQIV